MSYEINPWQVGTVYQACYQGYGHQEVVVLVFSQAEHFGQYFNYPREIDRPKIAAAKPLQATVKRTGDGWAIDQVILPDGERLTA